MGIISLYSAQDYAVKNIPEELKKHANAVIRNESYQYNISAVDKMEITISTTTTILNKAGEGFGYILMNYNPTNRVSDIKVNLLDENGKSVKTYSKKDFSDFSNSQAGTIYTDDRILALRPIATSYPYTVQYSYTINSSDTGFIMDYTPFDKINISLQKSNFQIVNTSGINLRKKVTNTDYSKVSENVNGNNYTYSYENIPAIKDDDYLPSISKILPKVEFSLDKFTLKGKQGSLASWDDLGKWYYQDILAPVSTVTPEIQAAVNALNLSGTTSEKVRKLYQYMQNNTRYVNVGIGIGGWQPMEAGNVNKKGYGDCKALSNYMRTLLAAAGIKSFDCLIKDGESVNVFDKEFPKLGANHMILMIPTEKDIIWLENTNQIVAFNHLFSTTTDRNVLAINENGLKIVDTPVYPASENKETLNAKLFVKEDNSLQGDVSFNFTGGQYDRMLRFVTMDSKERVDFARDLNKLLKFDNIEVKEVQNDRDNANLSYKMDFSAKDFSKKLGNDIFFRIIPFYSTFMLSSSEERTLPFEIPFAFQDDFSVEYIAPVGFKFSETPKPVEISSEFGSYKLDFQLSEGKLLVHRILTIKKGFYPKEKYASYVEFRKKTASGDSTKILITKS